MTTTLTASNIRVLNILISALDGELLLHQEMLNLAKLKHQSIIDNNLVSLEDITFREKQLLSQISDSQGKRKDILYLVEKNFSSAVKFISLSDVISYLPSSEQEPLQSKRNNLISIIQQCKEANRYNSELLSISLQHIDSFLKTVSEAIVGDINYNKQGKKSIPTSTLLDRSA